MKRRELLHALAAAALLPRIARSAALRAFGGELVAAILEGPPATLDRGNPRTLDPFAARTRLERELSAALHLPLVGTATPGRSFGPLLESASASGRTWTFVLRPDLAFHDGSPIRAEDAAASLRRLPAGIQALLDTPEVETRDPRTLRVTTRRAHADLPALLAAAGAPVVSATPGDPFFGPVGCGPFRPAAPAGGRVDGDVVLEANVRSPAGRALLDRLVLTAIPDRSALATALRKGRIDVATSASTTTEVSGAGLVTADASATIVLAVNPQLPSALRQRITTSPHRDVLANVFLKGRVKPASTLLPPSLLGPLASDVLPPRPQPQKGTKTRLSLLVTNGSAVLRDVVDRLLWDLHENAGVTATVGWRHAADLETEAAKGRYDLLLFEWAPSMLDAGWAIAAAPEPMRPAHVAAELSGDDVDARTRAARQADDSLRASGSLVPIVHPVRMLRAASRVEGLTPDAHGRVSWADVSLKRGSK